MLILREHCSPSSSSSSVTSISDLDDDLLVEILCRLPTITFTRKCKLVSKLWCALISLVCVPRLFSSRDPGSSRYPGFGLLFNTCSSPPNGKRGPWDFANTFPQIRKTLIRDGCLGGLLPFRPSPEDFLDCYNGMLLFFHPPTMHYFLCNPATIQYTAIPNSPPKNRVPRTAALIFDPHYKVVHISRKPSCAMNIYSPITQKWTVYNKLNLEDHIALSAWSPRSVFFNGSIYRLSVSGHMLDFNVREIGCRAIELPNVVAKATPIGCLGVSRNKLHYAWSNHVSQVMVWTLAKSERTDEWVLKYNICLQFFDEHRLCKNLHSRSQFSIYAFHERSDIVFIGNLAGIFYYDPNTKTLELIHKLTSDKTIFSGQYLVFPYSINRVFLDAYSLSLIGKSAGEDQTLISRLSSFFPSSHLMA